MLKGGVLGFGGMGQSMTRQLHERGLAQIVGVCDRDPAKLKLARDKLGLKATHDAKELCSWDIDFALVTSTNYAHHEHVMSAAEAGKHMLVEKPPALSLEQMDEMIEAVEKKNLVTVVNYGRRWNPPYLRMKELIDDGEIGEILSITCYSSRGFGLYGEGARHAAVVHPEESGGWLLHHACHIIDLTVWYAGEPETAYCLSRSTVPKGDSPEVMWGIMQLKAGGIAVMGDASSAMAQKTVTIIGTKATVELMRTPEDNVLHMRREGMGEIDWSRNDEDILGYGTWWRDASLRELLACIEEKRQSAHNLRATRPSLVATLALEEARKSGKIVKVDDVDPSR